MWQGSGSCSKRREGDGKLPVQSSLARGKLAKRAGGLAAWMRARAVLARVPLRALPAGVLQVQPARSSTTALALRGPATPRRLSACLAAWRHLHHLLAGIGCSRWSVSVSGRV